MVLTTKRRRLFFDIETSYCIGKFWRPGSKVFISASNIIKQAAIICICYKWEGEKEVKWLTWNKDQCDKEMLQKFILIANTANELVAHNGDKFDLAWIRTRCLLHGIEMFPNYTSIDTLKIARNKFRFPDNKLNTIANYLGIGSKLKTGEELWDKIIIGKCAKSLKYMVRYCQEDVKLLQRVFLRLRPHSAFRTHYGVVFGGDRGSCPECGSEDIVRNLRRVMASGRVMIQYRCKTCGTMHSKADK